MAYQTGWTLWILFLCSWYLAMAWTARAVKQTSRASQARDFVFYAIGFGLLFAPPRYVSVLWRTPEPIGVALVVVEAGFFAFAWWARLHLGRLWSGMITLREGHRVVDTGPYRLVRHPIYTGFIGASWAFALLGGSGPALDGAVILTVQMAWKAKREESFLREELGVAAYESYAARTPMLVPFIGPLG
jgi:protein-S-isoprenylcysteine O-methyltransferase Ste14